MYFSQRRCILSSTKQVYKARNFEPCLHTTKHLRNKRRKIVVSKTLYQIIWKGGEYIKNEELFDNGFHLSRTTTPQLSGTHSRDYAQKGNHGLVCMYGNLHPALWRGGGELRLFSLF